MAAIREAFTNDDHLPQSQEMREARGKSTSSLMIPQPLAKAHRAGTLLAHYADEGCPVDCGDDWTKEHIEALLRRGPHQTSKLPEAIAAFRAEVKDKVKNGYAKIVRYGDIKDNLPKKLKLSPVAMIPHKSRSFRTILDLSFQLRLRGTLLPSVNSSTKLQAPAESMVQLGVCMQRLIALLADHCAHGHPFAFAKLDIKDGFWRMAVSEADAWNFCYVMPSDSDDTPLDDILIVVPNCLQMGWCESPPFFCAASETARDIIMALLSEASLPPHEFEDMMMQDAATRLQAASHIVNLLEVFVDDFIAATNNLTDTHLRHFSRAMLTGVHSVFPPPRISGHHGEDPVSQKKLKQGEGTWSHVKEILGWIVDGANFTIQLPPEKCVKIVDKLQALRRAKSVPLKTFQEITGKLQHASMGIPGGKGLFSPLYKALQGDPEHVVITPFLRQTLQDWKTLVRDLAAIPTPVQLLVPEYPNYLQYTDACGLGAGGIIAPGTSPCPPFVWKFEWPPDIKAALITDTNKAGNLTINDLELAGMVLGWLVMEQAFESLVYRHIGMFCDNTSAVAWCHRGVSSRSIPAARLLRLLYLRQRKRQASSLLPIHIAGENNHLADVASRAFKEGKYFHAAKSLQAFFTSNFPLQHGSWTELKVHPGFASRVISCLRAEPSPMASLLRLPTPKPNIGRHGAPTAMNVESTPSLLTCPTSNEASSSLAFQPASAKALTVEEIKLAFRPSRTRWRPSPRPATWLDNKVPSSKRRENTFFP